MTLNTELKKYKKFLSNGRGNNIHNVISYLQQECTWVRLFGAYNYDGVRIYYAIVEGKTCELDDIADKFIEGAKC